MVLHLLSFRCVLYVVSTHSNNKQAIMLINVIFIKIKKHSILTRSFCINLEGVRKIVTFIQRSNHQKPSQLGLGLWLWRTDGLVRLSRYYYSITAVAVLPVDSSVCECVYEMQHVSVKCFEWSTISEKLWVNKVSESFGQTAFTESC